MGRFEGCEGTQGQLFKLSSGLAEITILPYACPGKLRSGFELIPAGCAARVQHHFFGDGNFNAPTVLFKAPPIYSWADS
jgi:hypothetical protein